MNYHNLSDEELAETIVAVGMDSRHPKWQALQDERERRDREAGRFIDHSQMPADSPNGVSFVMPIWHEAHFGKASWALYAWYCQESDRRAAVKRNADPSRPYPDPEARFGMFTVNGGELVAAMVEGFGRLPLNTALDDARQWIIDSMKAIASMGHSEVYDTAVREELYDALERRYSDGIGRVTE